MGPPPMTDDSDASGCIGFMKAAFGLRFEAAFFFAGAFLLAFFFAAIRCLPLVVIGWILVPLLLLAQHGDERMPRENAVVNRRDVRVNTPLSEEKPRNDARSVARLSPGTQYAVELQAHTMPVSHKERHQINTLIAPVER